MAKRRRKGRRRRRRNPAFRFGLGRGFQSQLADAAALAGGLIGVTLVGNMLPLPVQLRTGFLRHLTKAGVALGLGWAVGQVARKSTANMIALGGLASVVVDVVNDVTAQTGLALPGPSAPGMSAYTGYEGLGAFPAYEETGMQAYTGVEGVGMYGSYF